MTKSSIPKANAPQAQKKPVFITGGAPEGSIVSTLWKNPWTGWVGLRYLKSKKNSRFLSFITLLSVAGVALGVTAMIVVLSVMDGFEAELKKRLMSSDLHVLVTPTQAVGGYDSGFVTSDALDLPRVYAALKDGSSDGKEVDGFWPVVGAEAIFKAGRKVTGVLIKGINEERMAKLRKQVTESADPQLLVRHDGAETMRYPGLFVGQELAYELGVIPGDPVTLISPTETEGPMGGVPRLKRYIVEGVYHSGLPEQELHTVYATEAAVRAFLRKQDVVSQWEISVKDFERAPAIAQRVRELLPGFKVQDWIQLNSHLFASLKLERAAMFVILAFIVVVASFNIVTTLTLMVLEKKREISILKAMGARNTHIASIFLSEGLLIGALGVSGGVGLGLVLCSVLKRYEFITLPEIYYDRTLPVTFNVNYYLGVAMAASVIVLVACLYPSKKAAKLNPLDGIRYG